MKKEKAGISKLTINLRRIFLLQILIILSNIFRNIYYNINYLEDRNIDFNDYTNSNTINIIIPPPSKFRAVIKLTIHTYFKCIIFTPISSSAIQKRMSIRYTWGRIAEKLKYKLIFFIGFKSTSIYDNKFNDIIQFSFHDSYYNLTLSTYTFYNWTKYNYKKFSYIIKIDSDVYPNIQLINLYILLYTKNNKSIYGYFYPKMKTNRNVNNTNYIPYSIYSLPIIPEFVAGSFYIFPIHYDWINFIDSMNMSSSYLLYREDIQIGINLKINHVNIYSINKYYDRKIIYKDCKDYLYHLAIHGVKNKDALYIYNNCYTAAA